jgi:hypothetical protein
LAANLTYKIKKGGGGLENVKNNKIYKPGGGGSYIKNNGYL